MDSKFCFGFKVIFFCLFRSTNRDPQVRCTMLGTALLLMISEVYPQLRAMLNESVHAMNPLMS